MASGFGGGSSKSAWVFSLLTGCARRGSGVVDVVHLAPVYLWRYKCQQLNLIWINFLALDQNPKKPLKLSNCKRLKKTKSLEKCQSKACQFI